MSLFQAPTKEEDAREARDALVSATHALESDNFEEAYSFLKKFIDRSVKAFGWGADDDGLMSKIADIVQASERQALVASTSRVYKYLPPKKNELILACKLLRSSFWSK